MGKWGHTRVECQVTKRAHALYNMTLSNSSKYRHTKSLVFGNSYANLLNISIYLPLILLIIQGHGEAETKPEVSSL